jgi:hypothetical protein
VKIFVRRAQKEFGLPIKKVRSDNGTEFKNTLAEEFLDEEGIKHEFLTPYTPQQNMQFNLCVKGITFILPLLDHLYTLVG